jgi:hypothetical protein
MQRARAGIYRQRYPVRGDTPRGIIFRGDDENTEEIPSDNLAG